MPVTCCPGLSLVIPGLTASECMTSSGHFNDLLERDHDRTLSSLMLAYGSVYDTEPTPQVSRHAGTGLALITLLLALL